MLRVIQGNAADGVWRGLSCRSRGDNPEVFQEPAGAGAALRHLLGAFKRQDDAAWRYCPALPVTQFPSGPEWPGITRGRQSRPGRRPPGSGDSPAAELAAGRGGAGPGPAGRPGAARGPRGRCGPPPNKQPRPPNNRGPHTTPALRPPAGRGGAGRDGPSGARARSNRRPAPRRRSQ